MASSCLARAILYAGEDGWAMWRTTAGSRSAWIGGSFSSSPRRHGRLRARKLFLGLF
ncbi:hypothetical protein DAI22_06g264900 [Oryza sativa Japonica Group]|nr:hypothetical protein DAI22_06g264900 [Oryza sativa Japonica Group]